MYKVIEKDEIFYIEDTKLDMILSSPHNSKDEALEQIELLTDSTVLTNTSDKSEDGVILREIEIIPYPEIERYKGAWKVEERCISCEHIFEEGDAYFNQGRCRFCGEQTCRYEIVAETTKHTYRIERVRMEKTFYKTQKQFLFFGKDIRVKKVKQYTIERKIYKK